MDIIIIRNALMSLIQNLYERVMQFFMEMSFEECIVNFDLHCFVSC